MAAAFTYCKMELKRALRIFPIFMTGAVVLAGLLGTIALLAGKVLYGQEASGRIETGVVLPENDGTAKLALNMLASMDSVASICDFLYMDEEEGREKLESGELSALLIIPDEFLQSIMDGRNRPVKVVLPKQPSIEARMLREMTEAGALTLRTAQAAIYAADEWLIQSGREDKISQAEEDLNTLYLTYALDREIYFKNRMVSATGNMTPAEHFSVCFFVLFLILGGIPLSGFFLQETHVFYQKLKAAGVGDGVFTGGKILAVAILYMGAVAVLAAFAFFLSPSAGEIIKQIHWTGMAGIFLVAAAAAGMVTAVYEICGNRMTGMMVLFWGCMGMMFLAGGILPSAFLPAALRHIGEFMPASFMIKGVERAFFSLWEGKDTFSMAGITGISWLLAVAGRRSHG